MDDLINIIKEMALVGLPGSDFDGGLPRDVGYQEVHRQVLTVHKLVNFISDRNRHNL